MLFFNSAAAVKNIGVSKVEHYSSSTIKAGSQTWMIDLSTNGLAYFANNDGVLEFDGLTWRLYSLPMGTVVRSVKTTNDGRIYAGGFNEFGYFESNKLGELVFHTLQDLLPENQKDYGEVWKIYELPQGIVFQSFKQIMIYKDGNIKVIPPPERFHFSFFVNGDLYVNDQLEGLYRLSSDRIIKVRGTEKLKGELIWGIVPYEDKILIATADKGIFIFDGKELFPWKNSTAELLKQKQVYCVKNIGVDTYAFGTIQDGLIICDGQGMIIQHINQKHGLQHNTVLSIYLDQYKNLWLGLDNGLDYVETNSPLTFFSYFNNISTGYAAVLHKGILYYGTNSGVFYHTWDGLHNCDGQQKFKLIPGTQGQVWCLKVFDDDLFCGHNSGTFIIDGVNAHKISDVQGGWTFIQPMGRKDVVIGGDYSGLTRFIKKNEKWKDAGKVKGFSESSRFLVNDEDNTLWMSHGYKGIFRIYLNDLMDSVMKYDFYNHKNGLPNDQGTNVFKVLDNPVFTTNEGLYRYDNCSNTFVFDQEKNTLFPNRDTKVLTEDGNGNVWFFTNDLVGVYRLQEDGNFVQVNLPFRDLRGEFIKGFQYVYPLDENHVFFGVKDGFAHYAPQHPKNYQHPLQCFIRDISLSAIDSLIYSGGEFPEKFYPEVPYKFNQLLFNVSANDFQNPKNLKFSYFLEGFDEDWGPWQNRSSREFTNLSQGEYVFHVKAKNEFDVISKETKIGFIIMPPWYLSWWAYIIYLFILIACIYEVTKIARYRINRVKKQEEQQQKLIFRDREKQLQTEALKSEKEVIRLRNEKLRGEMKQKDKELANATMQMVQKSKSLISIKKGIQKIAKDLGDELVENQFNTILRKLNREIDNKKQWEVFESHFESVHEEFLKRLKNSFPDLTPRELKLCAYLRLNISSKEIANLMNISTRGVEISRYRLRKKLNLDRENNLTDFIMSF